MKIIHVTESINGVGVYGHSEAYCDATGCSGTTRFYSHVDPDKAPVGSRIDIEDPWNSSLEPAGDDE